MRSIETASIPFLLLLAIASCGSNESQLDSSKHLGDLTPAEQDQLCDTTNNLQGGYGRSVTCSDGSTQTTDKDRATCVTGVPAAASLCPNLTVGDGVGCSTAIGTDLCRFTTEAKCKALRDCLSQVGP